jgi:nucleotide-binding universal stress UspA family protein
VIVGHAGWSRWAVRALGFKGVFLWVGAVGRIVYEHILFTTDGSEESLAALDDALDIAGTYDGTIHALYVVDTSYPYGDFDGPAVDLTPVFDALREDGERVLETIEDRAGAAGVQFEGAIREDSVVHRGILEYADEVDADLLVMGTHGRRGLNRWLLGSVTERVVRAADVPVLTVRTGSDPDE